MWGNNRSNNPEAETRRVDFDFRFSQREREKKRITRKELDALLKYDGISTCKPTHKDFVKTRIKVTASESTWNARGEQQPIKIVEEDLLYRLSGKIEKRQYDTLKRLLGK